MIKRIFLFLLFGISCLCASAQRSPKEMMRIVDSMQYILPDSAFNICLAIEEGYKKDPPDHRFRIRMLGYKGNISWHKGDLRTSLRYYNEGLAISRKHNDKFMECNVLSDIGYVYSDMGQYDSAVMLLVDAARIADEQKDEVSGARVRMFMADNYTEMKKYDKAIAYYRPVLAYYTAKGETYDVAAVLHNIAVCYSESGTIDSAEIYLVRAIDLFKHLHLPSELGNAYQSYSDIFYQEGNINEALRYVRMAKDNFMLTESWSNVASTTVAEAFYLLKQNKVQESLGQYKKALAMGDSVVPLPLKKTIYLGLSNCYKELKQFDKAYEYHVLHASVKDSIINESNARLIGEMEAKYDNEKKESRISLQQAEIKAQTNEIGRQNQQKIFFAGGFVLMLLLSFVTYKAYSSKRKDNRIINLQKKIVEEKNREILDSITYARRLQEAILPPQKLVSSVLTHSFILYRPKDIVAGDFYWLEQAGDTVLFAAADCTGHGVPGAMVSVVCSNALNRAVKEFGITKPGELLDKVRELVIATFERSESEVKDGMDISLCALNVSRRELTWAGANNPLWIIRQDTLLERKADKQPIGKYAEARPFTTHNIKLEAGDTLYIFTDGYADQFGGQRGKKFKYSQLKELLLSIQHEPMEKQKELLDHTFESWRGELEQVDDVCIIGVRIA